MRSRSFVYDGREYRVEGNGLYYALYLEVTEVFWPFKDRPGLLARYRSAVEGLRRDQNTEA